MKAKETTVISLGGSLINPDGKVADRHLKKFRDIIAERVSEGRRFAVICGGGYLAREYQRAGRKAASLSDSDLDWLGIEATKMNASFMRSVFGELADSNIVIDPRIPIRSRKPVIIGAGWKPGCSTDLDAVLLAENLGAKKVINLSNIDYVYDSDPRKNPSAKPIKEISWKDFRAMVGSKWSPGMNLPFDPIASKKADEVGIQVVIADGRKVANFSRILDGKNFAGTLIG